ncbi:hypothetical protein [Sphingomonas sp.]|uniref:hypothetical protein n=1 Tax=Sphingomonas sp. TaxID=28214 RepID=UPI0025FDB133|nr:hypothetical protein [Sphingomonas sp.]MBV9527986.1 hypothetical protein [Sphingomonas sp.]
MRLGQLAIAATVVTLGGCGRPQPAAQDNGTVSVPAAGSRQGWVTASRQPVPVPPADRTTPLRPAQRPAIDPKSSEAAEDIARGFADLVNRGRFDEAYMLMGPAAPPRADFDRQFASWSGLHATIGAAEHQEGAAGSIYITVPMHLTGSLNGRRDDRSLNLILRRVNDVPGSTEAQRHWHIERIETPAP